MWMSDILYFWLKNRRIVNSPREGNVKKYHPRKMYMQTIALTDEKNNYRRYRKKWIEISWQLYTGHSSNMTWRTFSMQILMFWTTLIDTYTTILTRHSSLWLGLQHRIDQNRPSQQDVFWLFPSCIDGISVLCLFLECLQKCCPPSLWQYTVPLHANGTAQINRVQ